MTDNKMKLGIVMVLIASLSVGLLTACCALIKAVKATRFNMPRWKITSALGVSTVGVQMALKRLG